MKHVLRTNRTFGSRLLILFILFSSAVIQSCKKKEDPKSNLTGISSFTVKDFESFTFTIDQNALTISNTDSLPYLTSPAALIANFEAIPGSVVRVNGTIQQSGVTTNNFTNELTYETTAEDGVTVRNYKVKVNIAQIDPNSVSWQRLTDNGQWGPYRTTVAGYAAGKFWLFGAQSGGFGSMSRGVFSSSDAVTWTQNTALTDIPLPERQTGVFAFQNKIWLLGGLVPQIDFTFSYVTNAIWSSSDGAAWTIAKERIAAPAEGEMWTGRERINAVVFNNKLWVVGGNNYPAFGNANAPGVPLNDVWSSDNGTSWTRVTAAAQFIARTNPAVFVHDSKIYVAGGRNASGTLLNDVWTSTDGATWTELTASAGFTPRWGHKVVSYNNQLFLIGGYEKNTENADVIANDLWISENNGVAWTKIETGDPRALPGNFPGRAFFDAFVHENAIWIIGGEYRNEANAQAYRNDTWKGALIK